MLWGRCWPRSQTDPIPAEFPVPSCFVRGPPPPRSASGGARSGKGLAGARRHQASWQVWQAGGARGWGRGFGSAVLAPKTRFWAVKISQKMIFCMTTLSGRGAIGMCLGWVWMRFGAISGSFCSFLFPLPLLGSYIYILRARHTQHFFLTCVACSAIYIELIQILNLHAF